MSDDGGGASIETAIVEIVNGRGALVGSGVRVSALVVLTCHHVAAGAALRVRIADAPPLPVEVDDDPSLAEHDVVMLRVPAGTGGAVAAIEVPAAPPPAVAVIGHALRAAGARGTVPIRATVEGPMAIEYQRGARRYRVAAWKLDRAWEGGISGGGVIDPDHGVVIGIAVAHLESRGMGFVVPLERLRGAPRFAQLLDDNRRNVPRRGRYIDPASVAALCARQRARAVDWLRKQRSYVDQWAVTRDDATAVVNRFLDSDAWVLPVIGRSGTGKTFFLAQQALDRAQPGVFLQARTLRADDDLADAVAAEITGTEPDADIGAVLMRRPGSERLVVWLDGLNELDRRDVRGWFERALRWIDERGAALVVSCRPEHWERWCDVVPRDAQMAEVADDRGTPLSVTLMLGSLSVAEADAARARYGLVATWPELREPMFLRAVADTDAARVATASRWRAIEDMLASRSRRIANAVPTATPAQIDHVIARLADDADATSDAIDRHPGLRAAMVSEAIVVEDGSRLRFAFEWVGEHVRYRSLDVAALLVDPRRRDDTYLAQVTQVIARLSSFADVDSVRRLLDPLIAARNLPALLVALPAIARPVEHKEIVERALDESVAIMRGTFDDVFSIVVDLVAPLQFRIALVRRLVPATPYWPWRSKDRELQPSAFRQRAGLFGAFRTLLREDLRASVELVGDWLGDSTRMHGGEGSPAEVAEAVLVHAAAVDYDVVAEAVLRAAKESRSGAESLHRELVGAFPQAAAVCLERWLDRGDDVAVAIGSVAIPTLVRARPVARSVAWAYLDRGLVRARPLIAVALVDTGDRDNRLCDEILIGYELGLITAPGLVVLRRVRPEECLAAIERTLAFNADRARDAITALTLMDWSRHHQFRIVALIGQARARHAGVCASWVEQQLYITPPDVARDIGLAALAHDLVGDRRARRTLLYFAFGTQIDVAPDLRAELAAALVAVADDDELRDMARVGRSNRSDYTALALDELKHRLGLDTDRDDDD